MLLDHRGVEVAHRDDRHQVRPVPVAVEPRQPLVREGFQYLGRADGQSGRILRARQQYRDLPVLHAGCGAAPAAPFLDDDAPFLVDFVGLERHVVRPVLEHQKRPVDDGQVLGGHLQHVDGLVEAGKRVHARPEAHADRLHERHDVEFREVFGPIERHVLDEVRQAPLVVVFEHRAGVDHQPQFGAVARPRIAAHVVPEPVVEHTRPDLGIDRNAAVERGRGRRTDQGWVRRLLRNEQGGGRGGTDGDEAGVETAPEQHAVSL